MQGKVVVVTGASSGIGFETALAVGRRGARVLVHARSEAKAKAAVERLSARSGTAAGTFEPIHADFERLDAVVALADQILDRADRLDVLVNNAGAIFSPRQETADGFERTFAVNHLAPFLLTRRLLPRLEASAPARIVTVASMAHKRARFDLDDLQSTRGYTMFGAYGASKLANILFTRALARRLEGRGVTANCLHPGVVFTRFGRDGDAGGLFDRLMGLARPFLITPEKGARTSVYLACSPKVEGVSGVYFIRCRPATPSRQARDDALAEALWERTEALLSPWLGDA